MKNLNILISALIVGATIGLFFLLGPEERQTLFYVNLVLALALEGTLLTALFITESKYNLQNITASNPVFHGAIVVICWMAIYNLLLHPHVDIKWYYAGLIVITVLYALITIFTRQGGAAQQQINAETKQVVTTRSAVSLEAHMLKADLEEALQTHNTDATLRRETFAKLQLLIDKVSMTPAFDLQRNQALSDLFTQTVKRIQELILEMQTASTKEDAEKYLTLLMKQATSAITKSEILKK